MSLNNHNDVKILYLVTIGICIATAAVAILYLIYSNNFLSNAVAIMAIVSLTAISLVLPIRDAGITEAANVPKDPPKARYRVLVVQQWTPFTLGLLWFILSTYERVQAGPYNHSHQSFFDITYLVMAVALLLLLPLSYFSTKLLGRKIRRAYTAMKKCYQCGYDLRGNPDTSTCPECGAEVLDKQESS